MRKKNNLKVIVTLLIVTVLCICGVIRFLVSIQNIRKTKKLYINGRFICLSKCKIHYNRYIHA